MQRPLFSLFTQERLKLSLTWLRYVWKISVSGSNFLFSFLTISKFSSVSLLLSLEVFPASQLMRKVFQLFLAYFYGQMLIEKAVKCLHYIGCKWSCNWDLLNIRLTQASLIHNVYTQLTVYYTQILLSFFWYYKSNVAVESPRF